MNFVSRPTRAASELTVPELRAGAERLEKTTRAWAPRLVAVVGVTAYRAAFARPRAGMGLQEELIGCRPVWVLPNPSGLNAHWAPAGLAAEFGRLRAASGEHRNR